MKAKAFAILLIVALLPLAALGVGQDVAIGLKVGQQAPDFTLELHEGGTVTLSQLQGKPVVLNFWASWCPPCVREMPDFQVGRCLRQLLAHATRAQRAAPLQG